LLLRIFLGPVVLVLVRGIAGGIAIRASRS
jgi:hypothetical protein